MIRAVRCIAAGAAIAVTAAARAALGQSTPLHAVQLTPEQLTWGPYPAGGEQVRQDTAFTTMQARGHVAMGVDQYTSSHIFEPLPDGGRIVLLRDRPDSAGTVAIRAHMDSIAAAFARGDFRVPGFVHAQEVPGTAVMTARRAMIRYSVDTLPRGAQVRITTTDPEAVRAVHEFLQFQRTAHHAAGHESPR